MNRALIFISFWFTLPLLYSQKGSNLSEQKCFAVTVNQEYCTIKTKMLAKEKKVNVNNNLTYLWYSSQKIIETMGGYDGKLIHGPYKCFYLNDQLKEQGEVRYGLKHGLWKYWYEDGHLKEEIKWKKGQKNGSYLVYNDRGQLMAKGHFKKDRLHGKFYTYGPGSSISDVRRYKNGNEVLKTMKSTRKEKKKNGGASKSEENCGQNKEQREKASKQGIFKKLRKKNNTTHKKATEPVEKAKV